MRCVFPVLLLIVSTANLGSTGSTLIHFDIPDQFDRVHTESEYAGHPLMLFGSDRKGSRYSGAWVEAVRAALASAGDTETVRIVEVADLRGIPFFVKGSVKRKFPRDPAKWVLLDWRGRLARAYEFERDSCSILLFDRHGRLAYRTAVTHLDAEILPELLANVKALASGAEDAPPDPGDPQ